MTQLIISMAAALVMTIILETFFGFVFGVRERRNYIILILANILTNPAVNVIHGFFAYEMNFHGAKLALVIFLLEFSAVICEWQVYKRRTGIENPFFFSLGANAFSYFSGIVIFSFIYR